MATVGNLFVNVRGRTSGFVGDMKRAHRSVRKDFYRNEAIAREQYVRAMGKVQAAKGQSTAIRGRLLDKADVARRQLLIAQTRANRLEIRKQLLERKRRGASAIQAFQATPLAGFLTVLGAVGLTISTAKSIISFAIRNAKRGSELTDRFKFAGPMGGQIAQIEAQKVLQQLRMAQDPSVSRAKAFRGRTEFALEQSQMSLSNAYDYAIGFLNQASDFFLRGGAWSPGRAAVQQRILMERSTGLTGQGP
jgi:hypothetical protein